MDHAFDISIQDFPDKELDEIADGIASMRYALNPDVTPLFDDDMSNVFNNGHLKFIHYADAFDEESSSYLEGFIL